MYIYEHTDHTPQIFWNLAGNNTGPPCQDSPADTVLRDELLIIHPYIAVLDYPSGRKGRRIIIYYKKLFLLRYWIEINIHTSGSGLDQDTYIA